MLGNYLSANIIMPTFLQLMDIKYSLVDSILFQDFLRQVIADKFLPFKKDGSDVQSDKINRAIS